MGSIQYVNVISVLGETYKKKLFVVDDGWHTFVWWKLTWEWRNLCGMVSGNSIEIDLLVYFEIHFILYIHDRFFFSWFSNLQDVGLNIIYVFHYGIDAH